jgi:hypothetical protein
MTDAQVRCNLLENDRDLQIQEPMTTQGGRHLI